MSTSGADNYNSNGALLTFSQSSTYTGCSTGNSAIMYNPSAFVIDSSGYLYVRSAERQTAFHL